MPSKTLRVLAGECSVAFEDGESRTEHRGQVCALVKPDNTVLVHDADGYRPVAWLTRADSVAVTRAEPPTITAISGDQQLSLVAHEEFGFARYPSAPAGAPVGDCPDCDGALVLADGAVTCLRCARHHPVPGDASLDGDSCGACGLPAMRVERGDVLSVCVDRGCEPIDAAVVERFDREWTCPDCGDDLRVFRKGTLLVGCDAYPDCEVGYGFPRGTVDGTCSCGLPIFERDGRRSCLDPACERDRAETAGGTGGSIPGEPEGAAVEGRSG